MKAMPLNPFIMLNFRVFGEIVVAIGFVPAANNQSERMAIFGETFKDGFFCHKILLSVWKLKVYLLRF